MNIQALNEIKQILNSGKNNNSDCISLYDLARISKKLNNKLNHYEELLKYAVNQKYGQYANVYISNINNLPKELIVKFKFSGYWREYKFYKENERLCVEGQTSFGQEDFYKTLGGDRFLLNFRKYITKLYDYGSKYNDIRRFTRIKDINEMYYIEINKYGVTLYCKDFKLAFYNNQKNKINIHSSDDYIEKYTKEIFKRIFVKIENCPKCTQIRLYELRNNQLKKVEKQEKKLSLTRKINS